MSTTECVSRLSEFTIFFFNYSAALFRALVAGLLSVEDTEAVKDLCMVFCDCARLKGKRKWGRRLARERSARRSGTERSGVRILSKRSGDIQCGASLRQLASDAHLLVKGFTEGVKFSLSPISTKV